MRGFVWMWAAALSLAVTSPSLACSTFAFKADGDTVMGKSYDWHQPHGRVLINPRNLAKTSLVLKPQDQPTRWTSQYGSVTFNQHGQDMPLGGINEAGLAVEIMWLESSVYPGADQRGTLNELQWIQYQLDNFDQTADVVNAAPGLRVSPILARVHYLVCDTTTDCATFEYINGKLTIHHGSSLPVRALTNSTYAESVRFLNKHQGFGGTLPIPKDPSSLARFTRVATKAASFNGGTLAEGRTYAFDTLDWVKATTTKFQIVYSIQSRRVDFRTAAFAPVRYVDLKDHSFSCLDGVKWLDANDALKGNLKGKFMAFGTKDNLKLVRDGMKGFENQLPAGIDLKVAAYPQTHVCQE